MRDDINKEDLDFFCQQLVPALSTASLIAQENEANGIAEGRLGLLFSDLVPKDALTGSGVQRNTLAQKLKNMSNIPSLYGNTKVKRLDEEDADEDAEEADSTPAINAETGKELVHEVLEMLNQQEELDEALIAEAEQERQRIEQERNRIGVLRYEGYLEKKSPSHIGWQVLYCSIAFC